MNDNHPQNSRAQISKEDFEFLVGTDLFRATSEEARNYLMSVMYPRRLKAGERLISQGDKGDAFYVIEEGTCLVHFEKDGQTHPVCRIKERELVGEMAVLTGENRVANVDAETDVLVWRIGCDAFEQACRIHPELREYLTEIVAYRFASQKITADRSIGRHTITGIIGRGGWSVVYKGIHSFLHLPVAIKMLKHDMAMDPDFLERFQNEAKIIAKLNHENIVRVYDIEHAYKTVFIVMEFLNGQSLDNILKRIPRMPLANILDILVRVASGLQYAHEQGIIHQDIKPANIFITEDDRVKILDFGLACPKAVGWHDFDGTVHYMAPEQIEDERVDERTDIYSLGITAFEMATGILPFSDVDLSKVLDAHLKKPIPDPSTLRPDLPKALRDFISRAVEKRPDDRYQRMGEVLETLLPPAQEAGAAVGTRIRARRKTVGLMMSYDEELQMEISVLLEEFGKRLKELGAEFRLGSLEEL